MRNLEKNNTVESPPQVRQVNDCKLHKMKEHIELLLIHWTTVPRRFW